MFLIIVFMSAAAEGKRILQTKAQLLEPRYRQSCSKEADLAGYFWDGQWCLKCKQPSCLCKTLGGCDDCKDNFFLDKKTFTCKPCPQGCLKCCELKQKTSLICTSCQLQYQNIGGVCSKIQGCLRFSSNGHCIKCDFENEYYLENNGTCGLCPKGCKTCYSKTYCVSCLDGYYQDFDFDQNDPVAQQSSFLCSACNSADQLVCKYCTENEDHSLKCLECFDGYFYDSVQSKCSQCLSNCASCQDPSVQPPKCIDCMKDFILNEKQDQCLSCQAVFPNCRLCDIEDSGPIEQFQCTQCINGYYQDNYGKCQICRTKEQKGAKRCDSLNLITQCQYGFLLLEKPNTPELQYTCIKNQYKCREALDLSGQCKTCLSQMYLLIIENNINCVVCSDQIEHCSDCSSSTELDKLICLLCHDQYFVKKDPTTAATKCLPCSKNCLNCNENACTKCDSAYYLDQADKNSCLPCVYEKCLQCKMVDTSLQCMKCSDGWGIALDYSCWECQTGCLVCNFDRLVCDQCMDRYYYYLGSCVPYPEKCLAANENGFCYLCETITNVILDVIEEFGFEEQYEEFDESDPEAAGQPAAKTRARRSRRRAQGIFDGLPTDESEEGDEAKDEGLNNCANNYNVSAFYKSVNGYCLICSDYQTGTYNCPVECTENTFDAPDYGVLISTTLGWIVATIFWNY